jgi:hypothetical protein
MCVSVRVRVCVGGVCRVSGERGLYETTKLWNAKSHFGVELCSRVLCVLGVY